MNEKFLLDNQLCFRLYTASRLLTQAYHPLLSEHGLTYPQYLVLLVLWEKDAQPVNDIAKRLYLETNTVTPLIQRMEKGGILTRTKGTKDARQMIVKLTKKGKGLQDQLAEVPFTFGVSWTIIWRASLVPFVRVRMPPFSMRWMSGVTVLVSK